MAAVPEEAAGVVVRARVVTTPQGASLADALAYPRHSQLGLAGLLQALELARAALLALVCTMMTRWTLAPRSSTRMTLWQWA